MSTQKNKMEDDKALLVNPEIMGRVLVSNKDSSVQCTCKFYDNYRYPYGYLSSENPSFTLTEHSRTRTSESCGNNNTPVSRFCACKLSLCRLQENSTVLRHNRG